MTRQELISSCVNKMKEIDFLLKEENTELAFYKDLFDNTNVDELRNLIGPNDGDLVLAYFNALNSKRSFDENKEKLQLLINIANSFDEKIITALLDTIQSAALANAEFNAHDDFKSKLRKQKLLLPLKHMLKFGDVTNNDSFTDNWNGIVELYSEDYDDMIKTVNFLVALKASHESKQIFEDFISDREIHINQKQKNKAYKSAIKNTEFYDGYVITNEAIDFIKRYRDNLISDCEKKERKLQKNYRNYQSFIDNFHKIFDVDEITEYSNIISLISDEDIRVAFLRMVYQHNMVEYDKLDRTFNNLNKNSYVRYLSLLREFDINKEEINLSVLMKTPCEMVEIMLKLLNEMNLPKEIIVKVLEKSNIEIIIFIKELRDKGILLQSTILNYNGIFVDNSEELLSLKHNLGILKQNGLNAANMINNPEVLINNSLLEENINILKSYNLFNFIKSRSNYKYLADSNLVKKIDMFIELGYESYLVDDLALLNENNIERLYIMKSIGVPISNKEELLEILRGNNFIIHNDKLQNYITDFTPYYMDKYLDISTDNLDNYLKGDRTYNINGVILSKNRVNRNIIDGLPMFNALISGSILNADEITYLINEFTVNKEKSRI